ncbi:cysteine desulfurase family protein [Mechercharimyces sp. CAU 1602]|uniref:cysteine desulfurase family protein n=1 Tax=Mechercharimyces sp. CAU 1602 TaxID=2973933 RepID=UPI002163C4CE|nr:cysteine desulfurase family protein [Mechercharimyces sp. CAU 1602]MCS1350537.1 cysteine desulfurase [Mechercharimyces sp. CAU 1602]
MIYLDNSATTPPDPAVIEVMKQVMSEIYGNPSSLHQSGLTAERFVNHARKTMAQLLAVAPTEVVFTSGGTEANNLAIKGSLYALKQRGRHMITTEMEHDSVYQVAQEVERLGWKVTYLPVDAHGRVYPQQVEEALTEETVLVSVMHVNNEVGTIQPIEEIGKALQKYPKVRFHVDAVQSFGKIDMRPKALRADLVTISGHKFHGPKGIGCLYIRKGLPLRSLIVGGGQESGVRSGTENVPGIAGMVKAAVMGHEHRQEKMAQWYQWKKQLIQKVQRCFGSEVVLNGDASFAGGAPHILNLSFPGLRSEVIVHALEEEGVLVSSKSACSSKKESPSRVLTAMGCSESESIGAIRISMGQMTREDEIEQAGRAVCASVGRLKRLTS